MGRIQDPRRSQARHREVFARGARPSLPQNHREYRPRTGSTRRRERRRMRRGAHQRTERDPERTPDRCSRELTDLTATRRPDLPPGRFLDTKNRPSAIF